MAMSIWSVVSNKYFQGNADVLFQTFTVEYFLDPCYGLHICVFPKFIYKIWYII